MTSERELTKDEMEQDIQFLTHVLFEIRDYAKSCGQEPDDTLKAVAEWILGLLKVATFNGNGRVIDDTGRSDSASRRSGRKLSVESI